MALNHSLRAVAAMSKDIFSAETERRKDTFLHQEHECSAMHNIPNAYPSLLPNKHMTSEIEGTTTTIRIETQLLKQKTSRMYRASISINDIPEELKMDQPTVKRLLRPLGYASAI